MLRIESVIVVTLLLASFVVVSTAFASVDTGASKPALIVLCQP